MTLCRRFERVSMDVFDVEGLITVLSRVEKEMIENDPESHAADFLAGARCALEILLSHDCINTQRDFMEEFRAYIKETEVSNA